MPRKPSPLLPPAPERADLKAEEQAREPQPTEAEIPDEKPQNLRPGTRLPNGKRVPPPPPPKGTIVPKKPKRAPLTEANGEIHLEALKAKVQLRTRAECERVCEKVLNWMKDKLIDANLGNALTNTVRAVLQSKTATEEMELKVADRELLRRIQELEERAGVVEETVGMNSGERKLQ